MKPGKKVPCPNCSVLVEWSTHNPNRPFCSERCKNVDFCDWLTEKNIIEGSESVPEQSQ